MAAAAAAAVTTAPTCWYRISASDNTDAEILLAELKKKTKSEDVRFTEPCCDDNDAYEPFYIELSDTRAIKVHNFIKNLSLSVELELEEEFNAAHAYLLCWEDDPGDSVIIRAWMCDEEREEDEEDNIALPLAQLQVQPAAMQAPAHPFHVHIDLRMAFRGVEATALRGQLGRFIHAFLLGNGYFDPRRWNAFFGPTLSLPQRRALMRRGDSYYELWKVQANFSVNAMFAAIAQELPQGGFTVRVCAMTNEGAHFNFVHYQPQVILHV